MTTFREFRDNGPGAEMVKALLGLDISKLPNWRAFTEATLAARQTSSNPEDFQPFIDRVDLRAGTASTGELALLMAVLFAMDYQWLADRLAKDYGRSFMHLMAYTTSEHARAAAACLERSDDDTTMEFEEMMERSRLANLANARGALENGTAAMAAVEELGVDALTNSGLRALLGASSRS